MVAAGEAGYSREAPQDNIMVIVSDGDEGVVASDRQVISLPVHFL